MGLAPATITSLALAEYINAKDRQEEQLNLVAELSAKEVGSFLSEKFSDPEFSALLKSEIR